LETLTTGVSLRVPGWLIRQFFPNFRGEGLGIGVAVSGPGKDGNDQYDLGLYLSLDFTGEENITGFNYGARLAGDVGLHCGSVKDLAGVDAEVSAMISPFGGTVNFDETGITGGEINIGLGYNAGGNASMTSILSLRHGLIPLP
jgi:hypothetical protein